MGENLINTSRQSSLYGENSTLTGGNVSKEELNHLINTQSDKIQARNNKQQELDRTATNISTNQLDQDTIRRRIELLKEANREATRKADQLQALNNQKSTKEQELNALRQALESAKANATNQTTHTDRTVWSNFENQLRTLNWDKLTETNGVDQLANELKSKVENDFPTITKYDVEKYKPLINGYVNSKALYGKNLEDFQAKIRRNIDGNGDFDKNYLNTLTSASDSDFKKLISRLDDFYKTDNTKPYEYKKEEGSRGFISNNDTNNYKPSELLTRYGYFFDGDEKIRDSFNFFYLINDKNNRKLILDKELDSKHLEKNEANYRRLIQDKYSMLIGSNEFQELKQLLDKHSITNNQSISIPIDIDNQYGYADTHNININNTYSLSNFRNIQNDPFMNELVTYLNKKQLERGVNMRNLQDGLTEKYFIRNQEVKDFLQEYGIEVCENCPAFATNSVTGSKTIKTYNIDLYTNKDTFAYNPATTKIISVLKMPNLINKEDIMSFGQLSFELFKKDHNSLVMSLESFRGKSEIKASDVNSLRQASELIDRVYSKIDWNAPDSAWTINKSEFKAKFDNLREIYQKVKDYVQSYDDVLADPDNSHKKSIMLSKYNDVLNISERSIYDQDLSSISFSDKAKEIIAKFDKIANQANDDAINELKTWGNGITLFDKHNEIARDVISQANELINKIQSKEHEIAEKQAELNTINASISNNALTEEERNANTLREEKERELAEKQREKEQLEQEKATKERELEELNRAIQNGNLTNKGLQNIGIGYHNFNSGAKAITIGNENTVLADGAVGIGNNNSLSKEATNTFVLGSNVTTNIPNSVALGKDTTLSAPIATPSHTIAGTQYNFAGIAPVGTVSIGAEGKERTLTHLAAGRISNTSTDGINGSQLNAVIETLNSLNTELTTLKNAPKVKAPVIKAGDGLSLSEGEDGSITLSNALSFTSGNGMNINKEGNNITITNTKPFEEADKEKLNSASTNATSALEKANANEGAINTANGKIAVNEGKITTQEGKVNDLTSRVTANEGNITTLTSKVTTVTNTANEALGKANTAVQPDKLKAGDGISVVKAENGDITITNTKSFNNDDKEKLNTAFDKSSTAVQPDSLEAGNGISISKADGKITITNTQPLTTEDKAKYDNASTKAENAIQLDKLKAGNGISVNKAENGEITITNTKAFEDADKEKLNTASTTANNALEKANANEGKIDGLTGKLNTVTETANNAQSTANSALEKASANEDAINTANSKIAVNEGKITAQEGKINDLTSRVTANEGNITTLTGKVTTVTDVANEALSKANTNAETIANVSGVANEALGKANTAVQPDKLKAGDGISVNQSENGEITITNTRESGNGLDDLTIEGKDNITVNKDGNKYVIGNKATPSTGNTSPKLAVAGDKNIDATVDENNNVSLKLKDNLDVQNVKARTINSKNVVTDNLNTDNLNAKHVNAEKLIIGGNELGTKGLSVGDININENGIDAGNKPINNVADGEISPNSQQAINGRQFYPIVNQLDIQRQHIQNLDDRVGRVEQGLHKQNTLRKAGNASAMATAGLLQPHKNGQSGITAAVGQYQGQTAVAVGYSALSDNGKYGVKFSLNTNTQKEMGGSAGVGYFW